ncbi:hypothetical protein ACB092_03G148300 [Castanea dentata]
MIGSLRVPQFLAKQKKQKCPVLNDAAIDTVMDSSLEIRGIDTPPEKVPRQIFPATPTGNDDGRGFPTILMYHVVKVIDGEKGTERVHAVALKGRKDQISCWRC